MTVRSKDHDFAMARPLFLKASHHDNFSKSREAKTHLAYVAAEIKTISTRRCFRRQARQPTI